MSSVSISFQLISTSKIPFLAIFNGSWHVDADQTAFHASFSDKKAADKAVLHFSRGAAVTLLIIYIIYLYFQLRPHPHLNSSALQHASDEELAPVDLAQREYEPPSFEDRSSPIIAGRPPTERSTDNPNENRSSLELSAVINSQVSRMHDGPTSAGPDGGVLNTPQLSEPRIRFIEQSVPRGRPPGTSPAIRPRKHSANTSLSRISRHSSRSRLSEDLILHRPFMSSASLLMFDSQSRQSDMSSQSSYHATISGASIGRTASLLLLLVSSILISVCAEYLVYSISDMAEHSPLSEFFIGLIVLPIAGNVAEHVTAMTVASRGKMDLALGVSIGSSIQISLFVMPVVVIAGWGLGREMTLYFEPFETVTLVASVFVVNVLILNGKSNYLEGALLCACYVITM
jgi:Ca2+/H+ antiporter